MRGKKRTGDRDHHDQSLKKPRSGQSNMLRGSYRPRHNQPGRGFEGGGRSPFPGGWNPGYPIRLEATLVRRRAPRDLPREASPSPASLVASLATSPTTARTRRPPLHPRGHLLREATVRNDWIFNGVHPTVPTCQQNIMSEVSLLLHRIRPDKASANISLA
jgi:hypothetical protein